ncbi:hypothetical protein GTY88_00160 [Streptomyces sp. SID5926]|nr:hypothetical protein [Streptomyces sp. SID5926]
MGGEEARGAVECGVRFLRAAVVELVDVGEAGPQADRLVTVGRWCAGARTPRTA